MIWNIIVMLVVGLIAGFIARAVVPGRDPMGIGGTLLLGLVGSFIGGFLGYIIFGADAEDGAFQAASVFGSIVGAIIALLIWRAVSGSRGGRARV